MYQIGLVGKPSPLRFRLRRILESHGDFHVIIFSSPDQLMIGMRHFDLSAIVLAIEGLGSTQLRSLNFIDRHFQRTPVVFVAPEITPGLRLKLNKLSLRRSTVLDGRSELKDLNPVVVKLSSGETIFHRAHVRYQTAQFGEVKGEDGKISAARIVNLSTGGAQLALKGLKDIAGDEVIINVNSLRKTSYGIRARVRWRDLQSGHIGVEFCLSARSQPTLSLVKMDNISRA